MQKSGGSSFGGLGGGKSLSSMGGNGSSIMGGNGFSALSKSSSKGGNKKRLDKNHFLDMRNKD